LDKLGEGGFGAVFAAKEVKDEDESFVEDEDDDADGSSMVAVKVVKPRNLWEFHILRRVHYALPSHLRRSVVLPHDLYAYRDESFLILDLCPQGTLLDIVNRASQAGISQQGACLDELLVMFFTIELLRLIEGIHGAGFIHGDLKIDNCLLRLEDLPGGAAALSSIYSPSGEQGWSYKGIKLIDFGRTIETKLFPAGQQFIADWPVDAKDCLEMRENRPWTYQADYYGLAGIVYCLLFGKYIEASSVMVASQMSAGSSPTYKISTPFKRYWQNNIWSDLFDILLNPGSVRADGQLPLCEELGAVRKEMEAWLQSNCNRSSGTLKGLLKKIEVSVYSR
jgi:checkpoint serine/threonine-protein kinase